MKLIYLIAMLVALSAVACNTEQIDDPIIIGNIEEEIILELFEELALPDRGLVFRVETKEPEACLNATISTRLNRQPTRMELDIIEVEEPGECTPGSAPAKGNEVAGIVANTNYIFTVDIRNIVESEGTLEVTPEAIRISFSNPQGFSMAHEELLRIPQEVMWGYVSGNGPTTATIINEISNIGVPADLLAGYYGYFEINGPGIYEILEDKPANEHLPFLFLYAGSDQEVAATIDNLRTEYPGFEIYLRNARGESF